MFQDMTFQQTLRIEQDIGSKTSGYLFSQLVSTIAAEVMSQSGKKKNS